MLATILFQIKCPRTQSTRVFYARFDIETDANASPARLAQARTEMKSMDYAQSHNRTPLKSLC